jgi:hypothetical protein
MDHQRDYQRFKNLVRRICTTLDKYTGPEDFDPLMESWWKALRHVDYTLVERSVERFLATATDRSRFPLPSAMRPGDCAPPDPGAVARNFVRDYWRSVIAEYAMEAFGYRFGGHARFQELLVEHRETLGVSLRALLDELETQDRRDGRTLGQDRYAQRKCDELARRNPTLRHPSARQLPEPATEDAGEFVF